MSKKNRELQDKGRTLAPAKTGTRWADYFWANLIFFAFLFLLAFVVKVSCESPDDANQPAVKLVMDETFRFLLLLFGGGFALVTLFDAAYEFFSAKGPEEATDGTAPGA